MRVGDTSVLEGATPRSDEAFQRLLLQFSAAAARGIDAPALIDLFCRATREFFQVDGAYFWQVVSSDELVGTEANGLRAESFRGKRLKASHSAVAMEAVRLRKTVYVNRLDPARYPMAAEFNARSLMAAPLVVSSEVIGAAVFLHASDRDFFSEDLAAKATILAGQLGSLLEANRLSQLSREEHRRAEILVEVAQAIHSVPAAAAVVEAVADRLRVLLRTRLVCILLREGTVFSLRAVSAESPQLAGAVRARHDHKGLHFATDLAMRAVAAGEPISVAIDPTRHSLGDLVPAGMLIAAPFRTSLTQGAVLVYPRDEGAFSGEDKSLVSAVAGFGAVAMANAELYATAREQAHELHQLLDISSELGSIGHLDEFMQQFVLRASDFLGFSRAFIGLLDDGVFHLRWGTDNGVTDPMDHEFPEGTALRALINKEVFWTDDPKKVPDANLEMIAKLKVRQILAVPLQGSDGQVLGMFGVLDRLDRQGISQEDIRRAQVLAAQAAVVLEVTRNLELSEEHRRRAESLMGLALELNPLRRLPEFARGFVARAADMMGARGAALVVKQDAILETLALWSATSELHPEIPLLRRFSQAVGEALSERQDAIVSASATDLIGRELALDLEWSDCTLVRLLGAGEMVGVLCLADRGTPLTTNDQQLLQAIAGQASVALENARLFTHMEQANRHWIEIFDAISDFIVAHDEAGNVLRVNRSLANFIGVQPQELIGLNMSALLAVDSPAPINACPFCRMGSDAADEYVHPVLERTYLVSSSRVHGAGNEGPQVIHVLKDITDRREAERRYRELFDNVQEGLFFSTPDGRFVEVNDALVRMLGYRSREELLQVDIRNKVYSSPERHQEFAEQMNQHGVVRNREESFIRQDGSL
ncbi:MAG TPA: GAF domain-containing protein, partial [Terriglobales bacterium]|nr:GAF domain-containing protein [Terriglobales bacterium]